MESFDVSALYTNVSNDSAMQAISEMLSEHAGSINLYSFSVHQLMTILKACLSCNIFSCSSKHFALIRGLAMGQRLALTLAIAFMSRIEAPVLQCRPLLYCRYIDDCFVIYTTQAEMDKCFELMNEQSGHIKLTKDTSQNDWLPFLNVQINIANGICRTKWDRKPSDKNISVHFLSAHPAYAKKAIVTNMFRTATRVCSVSEEREESLALAQRVAAMNGSTNQISRSTRHKGVVRQSRDSTHADKMPFCLPFISDEVSTDIRQCLRRVAIDKYVSVVEILPNNLKRQLIRNRMYDRICSTAKCVVCPEGRIGDCMSSGVIYLIACKSCGEDAEQMIEQKQMEHREAMRKLALQEQKALQRLEEIVDTIQADGPPSRSTSR
ncbi:hypothetical protein Y032_0088g2132 [Ancylostoma ceylanicum]|nr:hypothetical protein Y032_0088g2132 [Ancylostoma ceylanicum]